MAILRPVILMVGPSIEIMSSPPVDVIEPPSMNADQMARQRPVLPAVGTDCENEPSRVYSFVAVPSIVSQSNPPTDSADTMTTLGTVLPSVENVDDLVFPR